MAGRAASGGCGGRTGQVGWKGIGDVDDVDWVGAVVGRHDRVRGGSAGGDNCEVVGLGDLEVVVRVGADGDSGGRIVVRRVVIVVEVRVDAADRVVTERDARQLGFAIEDYFVVVGAWGVEADRGGHSVGLAW